MATMKEIELVDIEKFAEKEVEIPEVGPDQVLIEPEIFGICGSDVHSYTGHHPFVDPPIVLGHEYSGIVRKVGENVDDLEIGQRVTSEIVINCGVCHNCRDGRYQICENGKYLGNVGWNGAMAEYLVMYADKVHKLPEELTSQQGAMVEPAAVGIHAVRRSDFQVGDTALVLGAGVIGNLTAQALKAAGASRVIITDVIDDRIEKAKETGCNEALNSADIDLPKWIEDNLGRENLKIIFDCVGIEQTLDTAINIARKGSQIIMVGVPPPTEIPVNMAFVQDRELEIIGSLQYIDKDYIRAINFINDGRLTVEPLITHVLPLGEYEKGFELAGSQDAAQSGRMKVMLEHDWEEQG
ncbi:zinc-dependent alcohol dehydrogenase [Halarsenatibacter silvermanii]|uniref:L-iditol 2-dehydrogenase n=1 Tax=Halarsenatibacter silvermanii TaxID=321763 RepID=A0A1G9LUS9_9FIRM|nr:alcohol dehydrogenase catalytic domain-containing protein [Halarsenatibacter silvermanii]SDL65719.1 L-iditol 2-dehydrogenase [Halarsenatibacter silvermanii]